MAVIAAFKLDNVFATGESPSHADGGHGGFGPGADEANFGHGGKGLYDLFGQLGFRRRAGAKTCAVTVGFLHGLDHRGMRVSENQRAPGADVIDILVAVSVPYARTFSADDVRRVAAHRLKCAHRGVHAAGNHPFGTRMKVLALGERHRLPNISAHSGMPRRFTDVRNVASSRPL